ncbi:MAG TPA: 3-oxoacyl-[acyl-carrier-protein] reductase [Acidobacteriota bacterium]|nr:3-oxoacyl-[acyl-carrier-protein] reductase [Acidobacteriota bacterium]
MFQLNDQTALVTGASRGIGREIARTFARAGAEVILASRTLEAVTKAADEISKEGYRAHPVEMDVSNVDSIRKGMEEVGQISPRIDILVNNAGIVRDNLLIRMKAEEWREVLATNLDGTFCLTQAVVSKMFRQRYGRIINLTSVVGQMGNPGQCNYAAAKGGIIGFTKALAREVASRQITVNAIAPGYIMTDMTNSLGEKAREGLLNLVPLGQIGSVEDVAAGALFLASKEAGYITGHVLNINGGLYM